MNSKIFQFCGFHSIDAVEVISNFEQTFSISFNKFINEGNRQPITKIAKAGLKKRQVDRIRERKNFSLVVSDSDRDLLFNWTAFLHFDFDYSTINGGIDEVGDESLDVFDSLAEKISFEYGYATSMSKSRLNPWLYLAGMLGGGAFVSSGPEYDFRQRMGRWNTQRDSFKSGLIRSVYPRNYFGAMILGNVRVGGKLEEQISEFPTRTLKSGVRVMVLEPEQITQAKEKLKDRIVAAQRESKAKF